ncbi:MAG: cytochrome c-type biogenesis CcmF C-terminal domain-containing protein, partial [Anaerolineaceae bacterium]
WGHSTFKTIGRAAWKPLVVSLVGLVLMLAGGIRNISALIGLWVASFALLITLYEFWRGVRARMARMGENPLTALLRLVERNRRRYGGYIIHFGVIFMAVGIIGIELFQTETQGTLRQGESLTLRNYTVTYQSLAQFDYHDGRNVARAVLTVERNGQLLGELYPRRDYYYDSQQAMTIPGVRSTIEDDIYVLLVDWEPVTIQSATFRIYHNPLINWFWIGGFVFVLGTLAAAWPDREPEPVRARAAAPVTVNRSEIR